MTELTLEEASAIYAACFAEGEAAFTGSYKMCYSYVLEADGVRLDIGLGGSIEDCRQHFGSTRQLPSTLDKLVDDSMSVDLVRISDGAKFSHFNEPW